MNKPKVSVIMAEYNTNPEYLDSAIRSILDQTYKDFEFIIIDDCGKNDVSEFVKKYNDQRIKVLRNTQNMGFVYSLNRAIRNSSAKYLLRMDTDDISTPDRIQKQYAFITANQQFDVVGTKAVEFSVDHYAGVIGKVGEKNYKSILQGDVIIHASALIKKSAIEKINYYKNYKRAEDFVLWSELLLSGYRLYTMDEVLYKYRVNPEDYKKRTIKNRKDEIKARLIFYPKLGASVIDYRIVVKSVLSGILPKKFVINIRNKYIIGKIETSSFKDTKSKISILQVVGTMNRGGAETFLMNMLRTIDKDKFKMLFLCYGNEKFDYENEIVKHGGVIIRTPDVKKVGIFKHINNIKHIIKTEKIDIVHVHTYYNSVFALIASRLTGIKIRITHSHTTFSEIKPKITKRVYFRISKLFIKKLTTERLACGEDAGVALFGSDTFRIINNGIIIDNFRYNLETRIKLRNELEIDSSAVVLGHVGRYETVKNHLFLLDIFDAFLKINNNSRLLLIGDGVLKNKIKERSNALGVNNKVIFLGSVPNVNELFNVMDYLVFPSLFEGMPVALIEAQANGIKCLVSDTIDLAVKLTDTVEFYSLSNSATEWANKIHTLKLARLDTQETMQNSPYNMKLEVSKIEKLYADAVRV